VRLPAALLLGFLALAAAGCGSGTTAAVRVGRPCRGTEPPSAYNHVVVLVLENHGFSEIAGQSPYLSRLARACGLATNYHAVAHPSLPNYLALTSGSTHGIASDCTSCTVAAPSIFSQLRGDWRSYLEAMPSPGFEGASSGRYAKKHNPAAYYVALASAFAHRDVPLAGLRDDLAHGTLSRFSLVVPDLCNDEHDCPPATGDAWLRAWLPRVFASPAYTSGKTVLLITYDEGGGSDNQVYTVVASLSLRPHTVVAVRFDHYSLLRTVERLLGLPCLANACHAHAMDRAFGLTRP
jgi:phosphatidylinositol-3-phosphatase